MDIQFVLVAGSRSSPTRPRRLAAKGVVTVFCVNLRRRSLLVAYVYGKGAGALSMHNGHGCLSQSRVQFRPCWGELVKRRTPRETDVAAVTSLVERASKVLGTMPHLVDHLSVTRYDDGSARTPGTMIVKTMGSVWVLVLKEPDAGLQMQVTGTSIDDALVLADMLLGAEDAPWETDRWATGQKNGKKKGS